MKLGTSKPGAVAPALVAFLVLAGSAALAATQEPIPSAPHPAPAIARVQTARTGHRTDGASQEPVTSDPSSPTVDVEGCGNAMSGGDTALERAHGLDRAIQAILERCGRGPTTDGLLNALEHLRRNEAKHEAHENQGRSGQDHGKPPEDPAPNDGSPGKSGQDHGNGGGQQDDGAGGPTSPPGGGNDAREGGGPPDGHGPGDV